MFTSILKQKWTLALCAVVFLILFFSLKAQLFTQNEQIIVELAQKEQINNVAPTTTATGTSNWVEINTSNISFKVPSDWKQIEPSDTQSFEFVSNDYIPEDFPNEPNNYIGIYSGTKFLVTVKPLEYYIDSSVPVSENNVEMNLKYIKDCSNCVESSKITVDKIPASYIVSTSENHGGFTFVELVTHKTEISIKISYSGSYNEVRDTFDKILSTIVIK